MTTGGVVTTAVEQAILRRAGDGTLSVFGSSLTEERDTEVWVDHLAPDLHAGPPSGAPALTYVTLPGANYAAVLHRVTTTDGDAEIHALLGRPDELTPRLALTSATWPGWCDGERAVDGPLPRLAAGHLAVAGVERSLRDRALAQGDLLVCALAWMLQAPRSPLGLVGCPEADRIALVWALHAIARTQPDAVEIRDRPWTFSTYEDPGAGRTAAAIIFLDATPDLHLRGNRVVVDLRGEQSASPQKVNEALAMVYGFEFGADPDAVAAPAGPAPMAPDPVPPPVPAGRHAELTRDLVTARGPAAVRVALDELEHAVAGRDDRDDLRTELETAGWGVAVLDQHVETQFRDRAYDRLVRIAFGATATGRETDRARGDAHRVALSAQSDDLVRALARNADGDTLAPALSQRWMREHLPAEPDLDAGLGPVGRFMRRRGQAMTPARERLVQLVALLVAFAVVFLLGVTAGLMA